MAMKCFTKLETAKERCPIVFQVHPSNFKVTRDKASPIMTQIGRFRTISRSQLSNPTDLPCFLFLATFFMGIKLPIWPLGHIHHLTIDNLHASKNGMIYKYDTFIFLCFQICFNIGHSFCDFRSISPQWFELNWNFPIWGRNVSNKNTPLYHLCGSCGHAAIRW